MSTTAARPDATEDTRRTMPLTNDEVAQLKVPQLKAALEERGLDTTGRKAVLVERLLEAVASPSVDDEGTSKKKAESPVEEPPAKKAKGKAVAKEEAAAPAEAAANEGKAAAPSPAAPAAPSGGGGGRVRQPDRSVPGGASFAVHEDYDVKLMQTNIGGGRNNNKFYIIQVLVSGGKYFSWNRWGRLGEEGQNKLEACASEEEAIKSFSKKFKDKTKNTWVTGAPASAFVKVRVRVRVQGSGLGLG